MIDIVEQLEIEYNAIVEELSLPETLANQSLLKRKSRELKALETKLNAGRAYMKIARAIKDSEDILKASADPELKEMASEELESLRAELPPAQEKFETLLAPQDPNDPKNVILEIRAGTGGDEAALFAADLYRMYSRHIDSKGWKTETLSSSPATGGGLKEVIFLVEGDGAFGCLKFESGVHRVQRVPATESQGRVHTSAASVVALPEAEEVDIEIKPADVKVDVYRSSGPGGQSVNTTDSAVRLTHIPTGLVVTCQDEKSQLKNKNKAFKVLRSRLFDMAMSEQHEKIAKERKTMVKSGDRSDKIRTYNFPQSRVTDHRIGLTLYKLDDIMEGDLTELVEALQKADQQERLKSSRPNSGVKA
ncbi:MAG: peptide chain release factor 1 [candidate division Zixibacteria bacterium]|nr:peptide chain release factor 1 [candidate division Zixibacteria bacterium]